MKIKNYGKFATLLLAMVTTYANAQTAPNFKGNGESWSDVVKVTDDINVKKTTYDLNKISSKGVKKTIAEQELGKITKVRYDMIKSAAITYGAQAGLASAGEELNKKVEEYNKNGALDKAYNFEYLQLEPGLMPPVISEANNAYKQSDENTVRASDKMYRIEFPARLVTAVPNWRNYLFVEYGDPQVPYDVNLPITSAENDVWDKFVAKGWEEGHDQAREMYQNGLARLNRDYTGMLRYKKLYEEGKVTKPKIERQSLGVTGGGNEMAIGDRVIRKTREAQLNPNSKKWFK